MSRTVLKVFKVSPLESEAIASSGVKISRVCREALLSAAAEKLRQKKLKKEKKSAPKRKH